MVVKYDIFGRKVGSHNLAMAVLGSLFGGTYLAMRGGKTPAKDQPSKEEENFIQDYLKKSEKTAKQT